MAHPYDSSREDKVGASRAKSFTKAYATGGVVKAYKDGGFVTSPAKKAAGGEVKVQGRATGGRLDKFARGGKVKKDKGNTVNIAIVSPSKDSPPSVPDGAPGAASLPPAPPPMMPPPAGAAPPPMPMPPPGAPPGMPMKPPGMMARGGKVRGQKGGGDTGVGRLDKVRMQKRK